MFCSSRLASPPKRDASDSGSHYLGMWEHKPLCSQNPVNMSMSQLMSDPRTAEVSF